MDLSPFLNNNLFEAGQNLFSQLGIKLNSSTTVSIDAKEVLKDLYKERQPYTYIFESYFLGLIDDNLFGDSLFSSSDDKISFKEASKKIDSKYKGIIVYAVSLGNNHPSRTQISELTRAFNRVSKSVPVILLTRYKNDEEELLSFSAIERTNYEQAWREGEKTGKVSLLRDIKLIHTHTGHKKILLDLKIDSGIKTFDDLYKQWQEVFNVQLLNKKFFQELANWYFWAITKVNFPDDVLKDKDVRNATNVIRLLTRLIFVWFIKEKGLVSEDLFEEDKLKDIIKFKDANKSSYYKAILQNLFFATLNTEMGKRRFRGNNDAGRDAHYFIHNVFRYKSEFIKPQETLENLFDPIPFLNGGLFECLDKEVEIKNKLVPVRIDGFSDRPDNPIKVPDQLFFSPEKEVDLNKIYDTKNKKYKVRGLINLLSSYKFTIAENTPLEEDIALDPELLGKVFENLLANYNPETQTTARKQTGSFYTPREIVNYMVDESLIAHLKTKMLAESFGFIQIGDEQIDAFGNIPRKGQLKIEEDVNKNRWIGKEEELEKELRNLISYSESVLSFNPEEKKALVKAIDNLKVLDPACGSGAFPMGVLHKLVLILHKLDPKNIGWKKRQIERAESIEESSAREEAINKIENAFEKNELDYGRKLYLIENCIYGIDIQPIAAQISKLRFFISLIVDQKVNWNSAETNYDIEPLPNLETKFVAANTLIGIRRPEDLRFNKAVELKENELRKNRERYFTARTSKTKERYRTKDKELREEIVKLIKKDFEEFADSKQNQIKEKQKLIALYSKELDKTYEKQKDKKLTDGQKKILEQQAEKQLKAIKGEEKKISEFESQLLDSSVIDETASTLASWDPYDQNVSASFFDMEWMFGLKNGFHIIIGNPPWGANLSSNEKEVLKTSYPEIDSSTPNSFAYFIGWAIDNYSINISFVLPDSILIKDYAKTRKLIKDKISDILWYENSGVPEELRPFVYVDHDVCVINIQDKINSNLKYSLFNYNKSQNKIVEERFIQSKSSIILAEFDFAFNLKARPVDLAILDKILQFEKLDNFMQCHEGIHTGNSREILFIRKQKNKKCHQLFYGGSVGDQISNYHSRTSGWFVDYREELIDKSKGFYASLRDERIFINPKIYITRTGNPFKAFYDEKTYASNNFFSMQHIDYAKNNEVLLKYILPFIVSKVAQYFIRTFAAPRLGTTFIETKIFHLLKLRIPEIKDERNVHLIKLVDKIISVKKNNIDSDTKEIEKLIDEVVYKLYDLTAEEIKIIEEKS